jgi:hypothetical protein
MTSIHYLIIGAIVLLTFAARRLVDRRLHGGPLKVQRPWRMISSTLGVLFAAGYIAVEMMPKHGMNRGLVVAAAVVAALLGVASMWAYYRGLEKTDELVLKIETEAIALAFALSILGFLAASQLARIGIIPEPGVSMGLMGMFVALGVCRLAAYARYR